MQLYQLGRIAMPLIWGLDHSMNHLFISNWKFTSVIKISVAKKWGGGAGFHLATKIWGGNAIN